MLSLVDRLVNRLRERRLRTVARGALATPPIDARDDGLVLFSMIGTKVVLPYLIAIKSLHHRLGMGRIVILDDGTLTDIDEAILAHHCDNPLIIPIGSVDTGPCPRGGTWERLLTILDLRSRDYVIQLDSDTVTLGPVPEVIAAIREGRSFTLRGEEGAELRTLREAADHHLGNASTHVQAAIEANIDKLDMSCRDELLYVRGCSGFAGFAPNADGRGLAERFSLAAQALLGKAKWAEWGSEQVTSNFVVANADNPLLLPYDRYVNYWNRPLPADARFAHFIGTYRYHNGEYVRRVKEALGSR